MIKQDVKGIKFWTFLRFQNILDILKTQLANETKC